MLDHYAPTEPADSNIRYTRDTLLEPLSIEFARLDQLFAVYLSRLRRRGRTSLGDAVGGAVIEDGEAEGLLSSLHETHTQHREETTGTEAWRSPLAGLEKAKEVFSLLPAERDMLLLALCVEVDSRYARLVAYLNDHVAMTRPTLGLAMALLAPDNDTANTTILERAISNSSIARFGLLEFEGDGPIANRAIKVPQEFWPRLIGLRSESKFPVTTTDSAADFSSEVAMDLQNHIDDAVCWARGKDSSHKLIVVSGDPGTGRDLAAELIAKKLRATTMLIDARTAEVADHAVEIARESLWHNAAIIVRYADAFNPRRHDDLQSLALAPIIYISDSTSQSEIMERSSRQCIEVRVPEMDLHTRTRIWTEIANDHALLLDTPALASRFGFGPARIKSAMRLAGTLATSSGSTVSQDIAESICRKMQRVEFSGMAQKLPCPFKKTDIVLADKTADELDLICTWAQHGHSLFNEKGLGRNLRTGKGLVCLFSGPPGTGKTMAAQVIARRLGYDVYRIDLSQVVNKYVGETEKNLAKVFDEAQRSKVVLFFDEAETLYGDRAEVKTAQDRFANIEIGYLLQRIETFEGVAILATNLQKNLDEAFLRRLSVVAEFAVPEAAERFQIWNKLLPPENERADDVDVELLSRQFKIAGGDIRNAIFSALLLAADARAELGMTHLVRGLWRELQKSGRIVDTAQFGAWRQCLVGGTN